MADFKSLQADLDGVLAKVNAWSASKEKDLSDLKVFHNTFLDTQNGVFLSICLMFTSSYILFNGRHRIHE
jgi:hypothetical protein